MYRLNILAPTHLPCPLLLPLSPSLPMGAAHVCRYTWPWTRPWGQHTGMGARSSAAPGRYPWQLATRYPLHNSINARVCVCVCVCIDIC